MKNDYIRKKYFVNPGNEPTYIMADWIQIVRGKLQFYVVEGKEPHEKHILRKEFELHKGFHFDNLNHWNNC